MSFVGRKSCRPPERVVDAEHRTAFLNKGRSNPDLSGKVLIHGFLANIVTFIAASFAGE